MITELADSDAGSIHWHGLAVSVGSQVLVAPQSGSAHAGRLLAVMGPSGAGKSVLLHALAGLAPARAVVSGSVWGSPDAESVGVAEGNMALMEQDVPFFSELTPRETIRFAAELEGLSGAAAAKEAAALVRRVGLEHVADRKVGERYLGGTGQGLSGGEQRRLALACAIAGERHESLPSTPAFSSHCRAKTLLADEPTTGLDTFQAAEVVQLLRELGIARNCATIMTIHQPRSSVWGMIDDVLLLGPGGRAVYSGPTSAVLTYIAGLGHECPREGVNPADFLIDLISVHTGSTAAAEEDMCRIARLAEACAAQGEPRQAACFLPSTSSGSGSKRTLLPARRLSELRAFCLLFGRAWMQTSRDKATNFARLVATAGLGFIFGAQFGTFDSAEALSAGSISSRVALLSFGCISMAFIGEMRALDRFAKEKKVIGRERAACHYSGATYVAAKALAELPSDGLFACLFALIVHLRCGLRTPLLDLAGLCGLIALACAALGLAIGAAVPNGERAMATGVPVMSLHMLTGIIDPAGSAAHQPSGVMLTLRALSPIRYALEALCHAELDGAKLQRSPGEAAKLGGLAMASSGDAVLARLGITRSYREAVLGLVALLALHLLAAMIIMAFFQPSFRRARAGRRAQLVPLRC
ncbi:unnamed protein product [Polarella glacialis]|uniref:ABC transporter domain-containing protein n=1 Tax=Polarella glacialis TaxID=89957 RepID=A0A813EAR7_POLGL|nr:unnamed protein product [Polarella glacialis]CAE8645329.1 unnamed protein product [Polarella glacialis]